MRKMFLGLAALATTLFIFPPATNIASLSMPEGVTVETPLLDQATPLSIEDATLLGLTQSLEIRMSELAHEQKKLDKMKELGKYESNLLLRADYTQDKKPQPSVVLGNRELEGNVLGAFEKHLPTGTDIGLSLGDSRYSTASTFSALNRYYRSFTEVSVRQPLLKNMFGYIDRAKDKITTLGIHQFGLASQDNIEEEIFQIRAHYWRLTSQYETLLAEKDALAEAQAFFEKSKEFLEVGLIEENELYAAEAHLRDTASRLKEAEYAWIIQSAELKFMLNAPAPESIEPVSRVPESLTTALSYEASLTRALLERRDIQMAEQFVEEQKLQLKVARQSRWPELDFFGSYAAHGLDRELGDSIGGMSGNNPTYMAGFELTQPLELRAARAEARQADYGVQMATLEHEQVTDRVRMEIDRAVREVALRYELTRQRAHIEELESKKLEEEKQKFAIGRSNSQTVREFHDQYTQARIQASEARSALAVSQDALRRRENTLLDQLGYAA